MSVRKIHTNLDNVTNSQPWKEDAWTAPEPIPTSYIVVRVVRAGQCPAGVFVSEHLQILGDNVGQF